MVLDEKDLAFYKFLLQQSETVGSSSIGKASADGFASWAKNHEFFGSCNASVE